MLGLSAAYNLVRHPPAKRILRRLDHSTIFLMISGSYTPFLLVRLQQPEGLLLLIVVWLIAIFGSA